MSGPHLQFVEIVNRLKRGTVEGRLLWEPTGTRGQQYAAPLDNGYRALVAAAPNGESVVFTMTNDRGLQTVYLDSARVNDDLLRLALLQLFVSVRDTLSHHRTEDALDAVKNL